MDYKAVTRDACDDLGCACHMQIKVTHILPQHCFQISGSHSCGLSLTCSCPTIPLWKKTKQYKTKQKNPIFFNNQSVFNFINSSKLHQKNHYHSKTHLGNKLQMIHKPSTLESLHSVTHKNQTQLALFVLYCCVHTISLKGTIIS